MGKNTCISIYCDGGARGNPGPAASAFVALLGKKKIAENVKIIGKTTNNVAEYLAVYLALKWLASSKKNIRKACLFLDSQLVVKQLCGEYKIKNAKLQKIAIQIKRLINTLSVPIRVYHIPRERNKLADSLVNRALDNKQLNN